MRPFVLALGALLACAGVARADSWKELEKEPLTLVRAGEGQPTACFVRGS